MTRAYYNEHEPFAAQWLRNLVAKGLIADGEVDERSIIDVSANDLRGFTQAHFFAGIGGWAHALRLAGWLDDRPVWTGSCPCQPFSVAGKGLGADDPRHLWPHFFRLIAAVRPPIVFGEQVAGAAGYGWLDGVRSDLARENYACEAFDIPACAVDAPHIRSRLYWVAFRNLADAGHAQSQECEGYDGFDKQRQAQRRGQLIPSGAGAGSRVNERDHAARDDWHRAAAENGGDGGDVADADDAERRADGARRHHDDGPQTGWQQGASHVAGCGRGDVADADSQSVRGEGHAGVAGTASADAGKAREQRLRTDAVPDGEYRRNGTFWSDAVWLTGADGKARRAQPGLPLLAHGIPARVGRLRAYGNAIVPQLAAEVIAAFMEARP